jgi:chromodomain-helicase-DNA-binding protein 1
VDNYIKGEKVYQQRLAVPDLTAEDREVIMLEKNRANADLENFKTVERIVAMRDGPQYSENQSTEVEYFCKWQGLGYDHATWETHSMIKPIAREQIDAFNEREKAGHWAFRSFHYPPHARPTFQKIIDDPPYIKETNGELKDFQLTGLNWLAYLWCRGENGILADEMGLGKVSYLSQLVSYLILSRPFNPYHSFPICSMSIVNSVRSWWSSHYQPLPLGKLNSPLGRPTSV